MTTAKQLKAPTLARRASKGPTQQTHAAGASPVHRCRPGARTGPSRGAERRIDNDRTNNPDRGRAGLERAQLEVHVIETQLRLRGILA